jgi:hypothetical protein
MMRTVSGPLIAAALRLMSTGAIEAETLSHGTHTPWLLDSHNFLMAPEVELATH